MRQRHRDQHRARARPQARKRWSAGCRKVALAQTGYGHFFIEHNRGHHVRVATPEDPASSRARRELLGVPAADRARAACARLAPGGRAARARTAAAPGRCSNDVLNAWAMTVVLFAALVAVFGSACCRSCCSRRSSASRCSRSSTTSSTTACCARSARTAATSAPPRALAGTRTTSPRTCCSTTCSATPTTTPTRCAATRRCATSTRRRSCRPGYAAMIVLACIPPLWRRVMDPRVIAHYGGDVTRANIQPRRRAADARAATARRGVSAASRCPGCGYVYDEAAGAPARGLPAGHAVVRGPRRLACPDCGVREKVDFEPVGRRWRRGEPEDRGPEPVSRAARGAAARHAARRRRRRCCATALGRGDDGRGRPRRRREPADALQRVRLAARVRRRPTCCARPTAS